MSANAVIFSGCRKFMRRSFSALGPQLQLVAPSKRSHCQAQLNCNSSVTTTLATTLTSCRHYAISKAASSSKKVAATIVGEDGENNEQDNENEKPTKQKHRQVKKPTLATQSENADASAATSALEDADEAMTNKLLSPMMKQYHAIKAKHKDYLLLFRLGDFYELFYEDAQRAAHALDLAVRYIDSLILQPRTLYNIHRTKLTNWCLLVNYS